MYKIVIPSHVNEELDAFLKIDGPHLTPNLPGLQIQLDRLSADPRSGYQVRRDLSDCWYIEVGDYRMFYIIDEDTEEVRFFHMQRYVLGW